MFCTKIARMTLPPKKVGGDWYQLKLHSCVGLRVLWNSRILHKICLLIYLRRGYLESIHPMQHVFVKSIPGASTQTFFLALFLSFPTCRYLSTFFFFRKQYKGKWQKNIAMNTRKAYFTTKFHFRWSMREIHIVTSELFTLVLTLGWHTINTRNKGKTTWVETDNRHK